MGRVKLEIKKIENPTNRQVTFSKRRNGLMKKAYELSVLTDIDIAVIMFSPSGRLTQFCSNDSIEDVITRFAKAPAHLQERSKRKFENMAILNKALQKLHAERGMNGQPRTLFRGQNIQVQELIAQVKRIRQEKDFFEHKLRIYNGSDSIHSCKSKPQLDCMETEIMDALHKVRERRQEIDKEESSLTHHTQILGQKLINEQPQQQQQDYGQQQDFSEGQNIHQQQNSGFQENFYEIGIPFDDLQMDMSHNNASSSATSTYEWMVPRDGPGYQENPTSSGMETGYAEQYTYQKQNVYRQI